MQDMEVHPLMLLYHRILICSHVVAVLGEGEVHLVMVYTLLELSPNRCKRTVEEEGDTGYRGTHANHYRSQHTIQ